ncbi:hypothetical protein [Spiroplasma citri]|uniref:hypothetical protein n=1 Tax=Spiroplasma citri TaxID=2133 RepID=UPI0011BBF4F4|nr:hypothetical protein [Spiroplasma citri]QED24928.1 hypothetical protein FRX96_05870 [Spiroplasma citri]QJU61935.1 hypothetical protein HHA36_05935 [Spiroplasma citri]
MEISEIKTNLSYRFNKSKESLETDLSNSLWVTDVVYTYNQLDKNSQININENSDNISALELARSTIKVEYDDELRTLSKLFGISVSVEKWMVTIQKISKEKLYLFLIINLKNGNYSIRGWNEEKALYILYEFILENLDSSNNSTHTIRQEI